MQIVIDIRHLTKSEPSGIGQYTLELLKALFELDKNNEYILLSSGSKRVQTNLPVFNYPNVKKIHVSLPNRILNALLLTTGQPKFDRLATDILDLKEKPLFFFPNLNIVSLSPGIPYVLTLHDLSFEIFPNLFDRKSRLWHRFTRARELAQNARAIIVPSASAAHDVQNIFEVDEKYIHVIPHGLEPKFSVKPEAQDHGLKSHYRLPKNFALFVGTLEPRKNLQAVIEVISTYRQKTKDDLHLVLVGKATSYSQQLFKKLTPNQKLFIHELGYVKNQDRPAFYRLAKVTLFPSLYEGFGLPIIESMASGTPVITSNISSMPEVGGQAAICVNPYNSNDIVAALQELLSSEELRKQKIAVGLEHTKKFSWPKTAVATLDIFDSL
jgi:glycosyltransferase involved in cell wall biosynthesis